MLVPLLLAAVLVALSALHVFWAFGGRLATGTAIPEVEGRPAFRPSPAATLVVAAGLLLAAGIALSRGEVLWPSLPGSPAHWGAIAFGVVFVLRAIGEFRLVGFFKKVRDTPFARWDTRLFSPLSLSMGLAFLWIASR
jgi:hypothetical protein